MRAPARHTRVHESMWRGWPKLHAGVRGPLVAVHRVGPLALGGVVRGALGGGRRYTAVIAAHVLEHMVDPIGAVKKALADLGLKL